MIFKGIYNLLRQMIGWILLHYKEEDIPLIMENNISQMTTTITPTSRYPLNEISITKSQSGSPMIAKRIQSLRS